MIRDELLKEIEDFLKEHDMAATRFGVEALRDREFVRRLRRGGDVRSRTVEKVRDFIAKENERLKSEAV